jgi:phosphoribosylformylglycinamidine synthase
MKIYRNVAALSESRRLRLLPRLRAVEPAVTRVAAEVLHFVEVVAPGEMDADDDVALRGILDYGEPYLSDRVDPAVVVVPRLGTISPWSSKATDIARAAGIGGIGRIERGTVYYLGGLTSAPGEELLGLLHDRMTETVLPTLERAADIFRSLAPRAHAEIDLAGGDIDVFEHVNRSMGLALSSGEIAYLAEEYRRLGRNPTDAELMMFAQVNSEHCRHKVFNARWLLDGKAREKSLFELIKNTYRADGDGILSAYTDNAAVLRGARARWFFPEPGSHQYGYSDEAAHIVVKVETHNHPTAIAPAPGAATGVGGEIRDEGATGRGARTKMGLSGYTTSNLHIPGMPMPWEVDQRRPDRIASALDIMIEAPIGAAGYNNEFGRPNLAGYFRTYEEDDRYGRWGYHKPIMIAGGVGNIRDGQIRKESLREDDLIVVLGGPAMLIGLGGGAASSMQTGASHEDLDFASVQRGNAEMERRAQEVINACWALGERNPIRAIHDVGAGGWSNALPELVQESARGARFDLRSLPNADLSMSPSEIWSNEAQERYVLGIVADDLATFTRICERELAPFAVVGSVTKTPQLVLEDDLLGAVPVDLPMSVLFGEASKLTLEAGGPDSHAVPFDETGVELPEAIRRVLRVPAVGSKKFLITIGDRTVGGLTVRDQMVGPWQTPVSDVAVTASGFGSRTGEALAMGERTPLATVDAAAAARMAVGEAITNIAGTRVPHLSKIALSANWMAAVGVPRERARLFDAVSAIGEEFCPALGISIPVGKDSTSMRTVWSDAAGEQSVTSPVSLIVTAVAPVDDVATVLTPQLVRDEGTTLLLIDLGTGESRLGGSALAQAFNRVGAIGPDAAPSILASFFEVSRRLLAARRFLAYHDRSDGGLLVTLLEMAFAGRVGLDIDIAGIPGTVLGRLFSEELGVVVQVENASVPEVTAELTAALGDRVYAVGRPTPRQDVVVHDGDALLFRGTRGGLEREWATTSYQIQRLRDDPELARQEFASILDDEDPGLSATVSFAWAGAPPDHRPKVAVLRDQGVTGQVEMAAAFDAAGFDAVDIHMSDLVTGRVSLEGFSVLAACGGFSYGDVLGAGLGWAKSILRSQRLVDEFGTFFARPDTLTFGVCNGCQMLAGLRLLIPGASHWPRLGANLSGQFESRLARVLVEQSPSILLRDMADSILPVPVAHAEGLMIFDGDLPKYADYVGARYVDNYGNVTEAYPSNPNGTPGGIAAVTSEDGRATIMMPHAERVFLTQQNSWHPAGWGEFGPWLRLFENARDWSS